MSFIVAAIIFCEASICTEKERMLVASVIMNRIKNPAFGGGKLLTADDVVKQPGAFSSLHKVNGRESDWEWDNMMGDHAQELFRECEALADGRGIITPDIVYFHDKSITKPKSWDNKYYKAVQVIETEHFIFYKIVRA